MFSIGSQLRRIRQRPMRNPVVAMEEGVTQPKEDIPGEIMTPSAAAKAVPSAKNLLLMVTRLVIDPPTVRMKGAKSVHC